MKNKYLYCCVFSLISIFSFAQQNNIKKNREAKKDKIKQLYIAYITQELNLNEEEAQRFWPVQIQYDKEVKENVKRDIPELEREEQILQIRKKYAVKFDKILGANRTDLFFKKDKEFRNKLIEHLRNKRLGNNVEISKNRIKDDKK